MSSEQKNVWYKDTDGSIIYRTNDHVFKVVFSDDDTFEILSPIDVNSNQSTHQADQDRADAALYSNFEAIRKLAFGTN